MERLRAALIEELTRVKRVVAEELEHATVEAVGPGAGDRANHASGRPPVFGRVVLRQHAKLEDGVNPEIVSCDATRREACVVVDVGAVHQKRLIVTRCSGNRHLRPRTVGDSGRRSRTRIGEVGDARLQEREGFVAAAVQREIANLFVADQSRELRARRLYEWHVCGHRKIFRQLSDFCGQVHDRLAADGQHHPFFHNLAESSKSALDCVGTGFERRHAVAARIVRRGHSNASGLTVDHLDAHSRQHCSGLIAHDARDGCRWSLGIEGPVCEQKQTARYDECSPPNHDVSDCLFGAAFETFGKHRDLIQ